MCKPSQGYYGSNNALSPAAQAILDSWSADEGGVYLLGDPERLAVALRTAASEVVEKFTPGQSTWGEGYYEGACKFNEHLKAIASELEGLGE